ncbi:MAG: hypothetical protein IH840_14885 [Candidatus Heimdallarchaeota archaeon]|nr:hypothetical protein [Candidatus Heimdallarchaeota archaeon]
MKKSTNGRESKIFWSWGFGRDSTYGIEYSISQGVDFDVIASDPGQEMDYTYESTIPFYRNRWEKQGVKVHIISRDYDIYSHFWNKKMVPLGWANPYCSSHFKRDLIRSWYRKNFKEFQIIEYIGHTFEELNRIKYNTPKWLTREYPNYDRQVTKSYIDEYYRTNGLLNPGKSACWFCPNKPLSHFQNLSEDQLDKLIKLENNTRGNPKPTLKLEGSLKELIKLQSSLDDFDWTELNCSSYCYT